VKVISKNYESGYTKYITDKKDMECTFRLNELRYEIIGLFKVHKETHGKYEGQISLRVKIDKVLEPKEGNRGFLDSIDLYFTKSEIKDLIDILNEVIKS
jgi:hypothetical protein